MVQVIQGATSDAVAEIFLHWPEPPAASQSIRLRAKGPFCRWARTLPSGFDFKRLNPHTWRARVVDPCFWSPEYPGVYRLEYSDDFPTDADLPREFALRRLGVRNDRLFWNGKRCVLRGWSEPESLVWETAPSREVATAATGSNGQANVGRRAIEAALDTGRLDTGRLDTGRLDTGRPSASISSEPPDSCWTLSYRELQIGRICRRFDIETVQQASRDGVWIGLQLPPQGPWQSQLIEASRYAAISLTILPANITTTRDELAACAPNLLKIAELTADTIEAVPDWCEAVLVSESLLATLGERLPQFTCPVIASATPSCDADAREVRRQCEQLQARLAPTWSLDGYFTRQHATT